MIRLLFIGVSLIFIFEPAAAAQEQCPDFQALNSCSCLCFNHRCNVTCEGHLEFITAITFDGIGPFLTKLNMSGNGIISIKPESFVTMTNLQRLEFEHQNLSKPLSPFNNDIIFQSQKDVLEWLSLRNVSFQLFHFWTLRCLHKLKRLDLCNNGIEVIPENAFSTLPLERLSLAHNLLTSLNQEQLRGLQNTLRFLDLNYNNIKLIDLCVFNTFSTLSKIILHNNPLQCDCAMHRQHQSLIKANIMCLAECKNLNQV